MMHDSDILDVVPVAAMLVGWIAYTVPFFLRKKSPDGAERKRDRRSNLGIFLQCIAYMVIWSVRRSLFTPLFPSLPAFSQGLAVASILLSCLSPSLVIWAIRTLGKQWSFTARLTREHQLITSGPYRLIRHPIYSAMLGMLLSTALAISHWSALAPAILLFAAGTWIRMRSEETLLREAFGPAFDEYHRRVGAIFPRLIRAA